MKGLELRVRRGRAEKHRKTMCVCVCISVHVQSCWLLKGDMNSDLYSQLSLHHVLNVFVLTLFIVKTDSEYI